MPGTGLSALRLTGWGLLALGGILLLSILGRLILASWRRFQPLNVWARYAEESSPYRRRRRAIWRVLGALLILILGLVLGGAGWGLFLLEDGLQAYTLFPAIEKPAVAIQCSPAAEEDPVEAITCLTTLDGLDGSFTATVQGARWEIEGEVLVWDPSLERFGLRSGYRLLRLVGYDAAGQVVTDTDFPASPGGLGSLFAWLDDRFPFVQALQETASGEVAADMRYELSVSRAGFSLQEWEPIQP